jgi:hypothetical protein
VTVTVKELPWGTLAGPSTVIDVETPVAWMPVVPAPMNATQVSGTVTGALCAASVDSRVTAPSEAPRRPTEAAAAAMRRRPTARPLEPLDPCSG